MQRVTIYFTNGDSLVISDAMGWNADDGDGRLRIESKSKGTFRVFQANVIYWVTEDEIKVKAAS